MDGQAALMNFVVQFFSFDFSPNVCHDLLAMSQKRIIADNG
jgi:hypothetical protein